MKLFPFRVLVPKSQFPFTKWWPNTRAFFRFHWISSVHALPSTYFFIPVHWRPQTWTCLLQTLARSHIAH